MCDSRCVDPQDKAFAQGLALVLISLFSFIPGPIMFGALIGKKYLLAIVKAVELKFMFC
jgi:hypothetical protein